MKETNIITGTYKYDDTEINWSYNKETQFYSCSLKSTIEFTPPFDDEKKVDVRNSCDEEKSVSIRWIEYTKPLIVK